MVAVALAQTPVELPNEGRLYQHYKGDFYRIICRGRLSEERDQEMVVYRSMKFGSVWIRPLSMFMEDVLWPDGKHRARFTPIAHLPKVVQADNNNNR